MYKLPKEIHKDIMSLSVCLTIHEMACYTVFNKMFVKHRCPWRQQCHNLANSLSHFDQPPPHGNVMTVKSVQPLHEPMIQSV